jgi:uncharacterized protein
VDWSLESGTIMDGGIRYVVLRADVLMGVARELGGSKPIDFVAALEESAFKQSRDSFEEYAAQGRFGTADFLSSASQIAGALGWGAWSVSDTESSARRVEVRDSPFAAGYGASAHPVCGAICGVLRAIALVGYGRPARVEEVHCAAQGTGDVCRFHIDLSG